MPDQRFLQNKPSTLLKVPSLQQEIESSLSNIVRNYPPRTDYEASQLKGLYKGPTSIAYLFLHLSKTQPNLLIASKTPLQWCRAYLAGTRPQQQVDPHHCGIISETLAHLAITAAATTQLPPLQDFLAHVRAVLRTPGGSCEWLFGRAGTLYLLRVMWAFAPAHQPLLIRPAKQMVKQILGAGPPWAWHGKTYSGAAHGTMGILTEIALSVSGAHSPGEGNVGWEEEEASLVLQVVGRELGVLLDLQLEDGNWLPRGTDDERMQQRRQKDLVQFCHGAPGMVVSLEALLRLDFFRGSAVRARMEGAVERGREAVWERGILTKEPSLCHGITGNAFALGERERVEHFLAHTTGEMVRRGKKEGWFERSDDEWGLFCGEAGRVWGFMALMAEREGKGDVGIIGYNDV